MSTFGAEIIADDALEFETRKRAVAALSGRARKIYFDLVPRGGRLCVGHNPKLKDGTVYWTLPDGIRRNAKNAAELISSGALVPLHDGLFDDTAQSFIRDPRL